MPHSTMSATHRQTYVQNISRTSGEQLDARISVYLAPQYGWFNLNHAIIIVVE